MVKKIKNFWFSQISRFLDFHPFLRIFFSSKKSFFLIKFPKRWKNILQDKKDEKGSNKCFGVQIFLGELVFFIDGKLLLFIENHQLEVKEKTGKTAQNIFFLSQKHQNLLSLGKTSFCLDLVMFSSDI